MIGSIGFIIGTDGSLNQCVNELVEADFGICLQTEFPFFQNYKHFRELIDAKSTLSCVSLTHAS